jgi:aminoglycoside phosphotransferase (APT) family kinase protein
MNLPELLPEKPIAFGRTAEIYAWEDGWVLKLFHDWFPEESVRYEAELARAVQAAGLPVPAAGEIVEIDDRLGLTYQRVDGSSMLEEMSAKPWTLPRSSRLLAELQAGMHDDNTITGLPSQRQRLENKIRRAEGLSPALRAAALEALAAMPEGERLCHGDFHPDNVLMTVHGPVVIDWIDAALGRPLADVARSSVILLGVIAPGSRASRVQKVMVGWYHRIYLRHYFRLRPGGEDEYRAWRPIVAAARMGEGIAEIQNWLLSQVQAGLEQVA